MARIARKIGGVVAFYMTKDGGEMRIAGAFPDIGTAWRIARVAEDAAAAGVLDLLDFSQYQV